MLKSYLVGHGQEYPLSHDLLLILEKILQLDSEAENLRDSLAILMPYSVEIRYPDDWYMPAEDDAREAKDAADKVLKWLEGALPDIFQEPKDD
jgi:HEPN domain-containing protein